MIFNDSPLSISLAATYRRIKYIIKFCLFKLVVEGTTVTEATMDNLEYQKNTCINCKVTLFDMVFTCICLDRFFIHNFIHDIMTRHAVPILIRTDKKCF